MHRISSTLDGFSRRGFLAGSAAAAATAALGAPRALGAVEFEHKPKMPKPTADAMIVLWMAGGMAHNETFDPKRFTPFRKGMNAADVGSTFATIDTAVDDVKLTSGLEHIAKVMDRGTLIRTGIAGDMGKILHSRHQYHWHTGYEPPITVTAPHLGAWISRILGPVDSTVPGFIDIGQRYAGNGEAEELKAFQTAGFLGSEYGPFRIPNPTQAVATVRPPAGMSIRRFRARQAAYRKMLAASPLAQQGSDYQRESLLRSVDNAYRLLDSPAAKAFDLSLEPKESYEKYNTGRFGLGCLLTRRLVEAGARFIECTTEYGPFLRWDTHDNGHTRLAKLKQQIDRPIAQLILDLEASGLLDRTMIVLASEFSRSILVEGKTDKPVPGQVAQPTTINDMKFYGMHRHFTGAGSVLMFGGGAKQGLGYGETSDESPFTTVKDPVTISDLHATMYHAMGIPANFGYEIEKRPFYVTKDGQGRVVRGVLR